MNSIAYHIRPKKHTTFNFSKFYNLFENSVDPDQLASDKAN